MLASFRFPQQHLLVYLGCNWSTLVFGALATLASEICLCDMSFGTHTSSPLTCSYIDVPIGSSWRVVCSDIVFCVMIGLSVRGSMARLFGSVGTTGISSLSICVPQSGLCGS
jgi:hypothetical protein